jgi:hypothetical protein
LICTGLLFGLWRVCVAGGVAVVGGGSDGGGFWLWAVGVIVLLFWVFYGLLPFAFSSFVRRAFAFCFSTLPNPLKCRWMNGLG